MSTMGRIVLAVMVLLSVGLVASAYSQDAPADPDAAVMEVVAANRAKDRFIRIGTAFHVGEGNFYTNAHVAKAEVPEGFTEWYLAGTNATRGIESWLGPVESRCVHPMWVHDPNHVTFHDVAMFKVGNAGQLPPALSMADRLPLTGQRVRIVGFPAASRGWPPKLYAASGRVGIVSMPDEAFLIEIESGFALAGSSGSPVLTEDGKVIGIIFGGDSEGRTAGSRMLAATTQAMQSACR